MSRNRRGGLLFVKVDGVQYDAKGAFTYRPGNRKRTGIPGPDKVHGYKSETQVPFIEGMITDDRELDLSAFQNLTDSTVTLEVANGKTFVLRNAWYAADGDVTTEEGEVQVRFEGLSGEEIAP